jgi:hypothetical protein
LSPGETGIDFTNTLDFRAGAANRNALFRNLGGMRFKDVAADS